MTKNEYLHELKNIVTLVEWIKDREKENPPRRRVDVMKNTVIRRCYELLDYAAGKM